MFKYKILFQLSGSIACFKSCSLLSKLVQLGHDVQVVCSQAALEFIGPATFEGLTGKAPICDTFEKGHQMDHIHLSRWCDFAILCPATANTINQLAGGLASDIVGSIFLAYDFCKPYWVAPAMNAKMYQHPATQNSLQKLQAWGVKVLQPEAGFLACGEIGDGRLMEPEAILNKILAAHAKVPAKRFKVLITSGGTREPIDSVRYITNMSTGRTGATIASVFSELGHEVCFLHASHSVQAKGEMRRESFTTFADLESQLAKLLDYPFDCVIHCAAVSDYSVEAISTKTGKISNSQRSKLGSDEIESIQLKPLPKLITKIKAMACRSDVLLVAFKLTCTSSEEQQKIAIQKLFTNPDVDFVVHNDLADIRPNSNEHLSMIYAKGRCVQACTSKNELAYALEAQISKFLNAK